MWAWKSIGLYFLDKSKPKSQKKSKKGGDGSMNRALWQNSSEKCQAVFSDQKQNGGYRSSRCAYPAKALRM